MLKIADRWFAQERVDHRISRLWEPHVARVFQCNMWHVRGRHRDLLVDAGMGISSLKTALAQLIDKPLIVVATHTHMDHMGGLHEFEHRLVHPFEAPDAETPEPFPVLCANHWPTGLRDSLEQGYDIPDLLIDAYPHSGFDPMTFRTPGAEPTRLIEEGDVIDLGDSAFEVMHLPGHSPGSIGLWEPDTGTLFSGDAVYDGPLLDAVEGANRVDYRRTMARLRKLPVQVVHAGHDPSFGRARLITLVDQYLKGL